MAMYPTLQSVYPSQQVTDTFRGYNHNPKIAGSEFYEMTNLTSDCYPLLANRPKRGKVKTLSAPRALLGKSQLAYIDGTSLFYGEEDLTAYLGAAGFVLSDDEAMLPKQLVSMGAYMVIFPDKLYINTENYEDCGSLEAVFSTSEGSAVTYTICTADGENYGTPTVSSSAPADPVGGALWLDTSDTIHALRIYSEQSDLWTDIATVYVKISAAGIGTQFADYDGVTISGAAADDGGILASQLDDLNGSHVIYSRTDDSIVVVGLLDQVYTQTTGSVTVERRVPDMDFVTEASNRLWGCKYGLVDGETVNEIYCCALGDFKNWRRYMGISTDSYAASVGTDGPWTGAVTYLGNPIFFKETCLHKVYISASGAHQIVDTACRGVQKGSHRSLTVVGETLFYKAPGEICAYDGSLPVSVSSNLGTVRYGEAVGGAYRDKYYLSMTDADDNAHLFVYDTLRKLWHREDDSAVQMFASCGGELYFTDGDGTLWSVGGSAGEAEGEIQWSATTGLMGYSTVERKYISRFNLRMMLPVGSNAEVFVQYDSDGVWHPAGSMVGRGTGTFMLPVRPRRCDHFQVRLQGTGDFRLFSFSKLFEKGSDEP